MKAASTDDRFQDDKKGGPILTEGALSSRPSYREDGAGGGPSSQEDVAGGPHLPGKMGPGGSQNFMTPGDLAFRVFHPPAQYMLKHTIPCSVTLVVHCLHMKGVYMWQVTVSN